MTGAVEPSEGIYPSAGAATPRHPLLETIGRKLGFPGGQTEPSSLKAELEAVSIALSFEELGRYCTRLSAIGLDYVDPIYQGLSDSYKAKGAIYESTSDLKNVFGNLSAVGGWLFINSEEEELGNSPAFINGIQQGEIFIPTDVDWEKLCGFLTQLGSEFGGQKYTYCDPFDGDPICLFHLGCRMYGDYGTVPDNKLLPDDISIAALKPRL